MLELWYLCVLVSVVKQKLALLKIYRSTCNLLYLMSCKVDRSTGGRWEVAKEKAYSEVHLRLDAEEGENDLYRLDRQRAGNEGQQVRMIKDRTGNVPMSEESVFRRWEEYFEELMNEENE